MERPEPNKQGMTFGPMSVLLLKMPLGHREIGPWANLVVVFVCVLFFSPI